MEVEFVSADFVHALVRRIGEARTDALEGFEQMPGPGTPGEAEYWERVLEVNAARVLDVLQHVHLAPGYTVRYRFYQMSGGELQVRPFVSRTTTDVEGVKHLLDWHAAPDAGAVDVGRDADLLYRHFRFARTAEGVFEYWFAMQEVWASTRWAHARVIASADELGQLTSHEDWRVDNVVEHCAPAVFNTAETSHLAVLVYSPLGQQRVALEQIGIGADQVVRYSEPTLVASGPRGWVL